MLSRVAESIYWMSRNIERADNVARLADVNIELALDTITTWQRQWLPVVTSTGDRALFDRLYDEATEENAIRFLTFDNRNPNSIISCLRSARENARSIREIISTEMWEAINTYYIYVNEASRDPQVLAVPHDFLKRVKNDSHLIIGLTVTSMSHGEGWHFCRLGRLIERADKTSRIVDLKYWYLLPKPSDVGSTYDATQWAAILRTASATEAYRQKHGLVSPERVIEFLLLDVEFPRSILYCLIRALDSLHAISGSRDLMTFTNEAEQRCGQLRAELAYKRVEEIIDYGLHEYLDNFQAKLNAVGEAIHNTYFDLRPAGEDAVQPRMVRT